MPTKAELYSQLASNTARRLTGNWERWADFLSLAGRLYKYPYSDQLLIYAQRPDATACAEYDVWNNNADFNERQAILHQFIKEVRVGRNYEVDIVLNVSLEEFEEFKAHSMAGSMKKPGQMDLKPAPESLSGSSNASIVVMDENTDQPLSILPRNLVRASVTYSS